MSTTAGWGELLVSMNVVTDIDMMPIPDDRHRNPPWILFLVFFMIVGFFVFLNLFIGVVINTFHKE